MTGRRLQIPPDLIRAQLDKIVTSQVFARSPQAGRFLRYIVEKSLEGSADTLREVTIGVEVFARGSSFDPRTDNIVRVDARRLRGKLQKYYATDGLHDRVSIALEPGGYAPVFSLRDRRESPAAALSR